MARTVKPEAVAAKRKEILQAAQRLVLTKGYEQMSIQDILDEVKISSGAFHHYFDSRGALLEAFIEQMQRETEQPLLPIIHHPHLTAIEKLQGYFDTLDRMRLDRRVDLVKLLRVWYSDDNAIIRQKVDEAVFERRAPLLSEIVRQGVREGSFNTTQPDNAGVILMSLLQGMANTHARLLLAFDHDHDEKRCTRQVVTVHASYMEAIERVLGATPYSFSRTTAGAVSVWLAALREREHA